MPVNLNLPQAHAVAGVEWTTLAAGIKANGTPDMVVARLVEGSTCSAVFTKSTFSAAPVSICRQHMLECHGAVRALLINSGNANAGTGHPGIDMALGHCAALARALSLPVTSVLPFSTGVIGQLLPDDVMLAGIAESASLLDAGDTTGVEAWQSAARGIMTTDTQPKLTSQQIEVAGQSITITGMAKGAGMIQPDMATMLSYIFTDALVAQDDLDVALQEAVDVSFNAITVDSDTSTNDSCVLVATGAAAAASGSGAGTSASGNASAEASNSESTSASTANNSIGVAHPDWAVFMRALKRVFSDLAQAIIRDAEGATKFISVHVSGGVSTAECKQVAYAIANSPLVKTAMFASDANVGRLLMAIGKAGVVGLDASKIRVSLGDVRAFEAGGIAVEYTEARGAAVMAQDEIDVYVELGRGDSEATVFTSDLSHEYVSINADYRS